MHKYLLIIIILLIILNCIYNYIKYVNKINNDPNIIYDLANNSAKKIIININNFKPYITKYFYKYNLNSSKINLKQDNKIFVSVASYRDPQCPITIEELINKSDNPKNLVIVICQQNDITDIECINDNLNLKGATVKIIKMDYTEARGPTFARYLIQEKWEGEQYYLQIDSHTRFVNSWDTKCINELNKVISDTKNNKICLSNYVSTYDVITNKINDNNLRNIMYISEINNQDGFPRFNSKFVDKLDNPLKSYGWSGCFSFSLSNIINDVPYEPYSPFIFFGEEMDMLTRLISYKWEIYIPSIPICFTTFDRTYRKTFWENPDQNITNELSKLRYYIKYDLVDKSLIDLVPKELLLDLDIYKLNNNIKYIDVYNNLLNKTY
jgi:hypothetical protein